MAWSARESVISESQANDTEWLPSHLDVCIEGVMARGFDRQVAEQQVRAALLNRFT
jgi:hypothetical protein